jgi:hypothetical protein
MQLVLEGGGGHTEFCFGNLSEHSQLEDKKGDGIGCEGSKCQKIQTGFFL